MGDRGNVQIISATEGAADIYFYTHWYGSNLSAIVAEAISSPQGKSRQDDESYLNRIIFEKMLECADDKATGFGISPYEIDCGVLVVVNHKTKTMLIDSLEIPFKALDMTIARAQ